MLGAIGALRVGGRRSRDRYAFPVGQGRRWKRCIALLLPAALLIQVGCGATMPPHDTARLWTQDLARWVATGNAGSLWDRSCLRERQRWLQVVELARAAVTATFSDVPSWLLDSPLGTVSWPFAPRPSTGRPLLEIDQLRHTTLRQTASEAIVDVSGQVSATYVMTWTGPIQVRLRMVHEEGDWRWCGLVT